MHDDTCIDFLQWALPRLEKRWPGFRKVRGQVGKRIDRRMHALGLRSTDAYRAYLEVHPEEWDVLDAMCRITISRFYRDHGVFDALRAKVLPDLRARAVQEGRNVRCWSAGCASGEEVYTLAIIWREELTPRFPRTNLQVVATDAQAHMLERARRACYPRATLKELPDAWRERAFVHTPNADEPYCLHAAYRQGITWQQQDIREVMPEGPFDLLLCRNLVFTYFAGPLQRRCLDRMLVRLRPGGFLILGKHERPPDHGALETWAVHRRIYRKVASSDGCGHTAQGASGS